MCVICTLTQVHIDRVFKRWYDTLIPLSGGLLVALSDSRRKANDKYIKANYSRVALSMPKAEAEALEEYCKRHNISKAGFIRDLIKAAIKAEREGAASETVPEGFC